jgi:HPt (histidine-containing phosphotransfer) domain-containing protein
MADKIELAKSAVEELCKVCYDAGITANERINEVNEETRCAIDWEMVVGICDDEELIGQIVVIFLDDGRDTFEKLSESIREDNITDIASYSHKLKGASANVGARYLSEISRRLEEAARGEKAEDIPSIFAELEPEFHRVMSFLKRADWIEQAKHSCGQGSQS